MRKLNDPNKPPRTRKPGKRRRKGEYATFDVQIEGLSAKAQELRTQSTFVDDFDGSVQTMKPEVVAAREHEAKSYADYAKKLSDHRQKFINETIEMQRKQRERAEKLVQSKAQPTLRSNAKPGQGAIPLGDKLEVIVHHKDKPWRRL